MKYSEFRECLKSNDFGMRENDEMIIADDQFEISKKREQTIWFLAGFIDSPYEYEMLKKVIELVETPLDEREGEKKCYIKHRFINDYSTRNYINVVATGKAVLSDRREDRIFQTKFTKEEIEELKEKFDTDLSDFELIEVED